MIIEMKQATSLIAVFIFYDKANGVQSSLSFSETFKHCNIITYDGKDWVMLDFDRTGFLTRTIHCKDGEQLVRNLHIIKEISAIVSVDVKERVKIAWKPFMVRSCNEICRYTAGIDIGFTFNPIHLYSKLLKYRHTSNYEVISAWRRKNGIPRR